MTMEAKFIIHTPEHTGKECCICCSSLEGLDDIVLACNHEFHYDCISQWYEKTINGKHDFADSSLRECPYCRKSGGYLPYVNGKKYNKHIHGYLQKVSTNSSVSKCHAFTKVGNPCKKSGNYNGFCFIHRKK